MIDDCSMPTLRQYHSVSFLKSSRACSINRVILSRSADGNGSRIWSSTPGTSVTRCQRSSCLSGGTTEVDVLSFLPRRRGTSLLRRLPLDVTGFDGDNGSACPACSGVGAGGAKGASRNCSSPLGPDVPDRDAAAFFEIPS